MEATISHTQDDRLTDEQRQILDSAQDEMNTAAGQEAYEAAHESYQRMYEDMIAENEAGQHPAEHDEELNPSEQQTDEAIRTASDGIQRAGGPNDDVAVNITTGEDGTTVISAAELGDADALSLREKIDAAHAANGTENPTDPATSTRAPQPQDDRTPAEKTAGGDSAEFKQEAGEFAGDVSNQPIAGLPQASDENQQLEMFPETLTGTGKLDFTVGGKKPNRATLTLTGGKIDVEGAYEKGETIELRVTAKVNDLGFKDIEDSKTGQVTDCERRHKARIVGMAVIE